MAPVAAVVAVGVDCNWAGSTVVDRHCHQLRHRPCWVVAVDWPVVYRRLVLVVVRPLTLVVPFAVDDLPAGALQRPVDWLVVVVLDSLLIPRRNGVLNQLVEPDNHAKLCQSGGRYKCSLVDLALQSVAAAVEQVLVLVAVVPRQLAPHHY